MVEWSAIEATCPVSTSKCGIAVRTHRERGKGGKKGGEGGRGPPRAFSRLKVLPPDGVRHFGQ
jgi:hypothetical protein